MQPAKSQSPTTALVLGILSIFLCSLPIVGLLLGITGLQKSKVAEQEVAQGIADPSEAGLAKAGKICSIVGTCMSCLATVFFCVWLSCLGTMMIGGFGAAAAGRPHP